ncbi:XylR family transcriptional regulator [Oceaniferula marina]|uniref:XylR family transcriptional regulator n=1 Tax=Oceaniferula marina TaxID=2748318 RepID=UPI0015B81AEC|nr:substrate-binding domain-containing protein [Oceaniferula marina]
MKTQPHHHDVLRIGLRVPEWSKYGDAIIRGILQFVREYNLTWHMDIPVYSDHELEPVNIDDSWQGDGLIVFRCSEDEHAAWKKRGIQIINLSAETRIPSLPNVLPDNEEIGKVAADYLISRGLNHFCYVGDSTRHYSNLRQNGFQKELERRGRSCFTVDVPISQTKGKQRWKEIQQRMKDQLVNTTKPIGILTRDDMAAMNLLKVAEQMNIQVPQDWAVVGVGDSSPFCQSARPPITSIHYPNERIGYQAAKLMHQMITAQAPGQDIMLPVGGITERESSNMLSFKDDSIAKAVSYIHKHAAKGPVNIADLSAQFGMSYTGFRQRFKKIMGHTAKEEIDNVRMNQIRSMLANSELHIQEIGYQMNFQTPEDLSRFFQRHQGMSPTAYRALLK